MGAESFLMPAACGNCGRVFDFNDITDTASIERMRVKHSDVVLCKRCLNENEVVVE